MIITILGHHPRHFIHVLSFHIFCFAAHTALQIIQIDSAQGFNFFVITLWLLFVLIISEKNRIPNRSVSLSVKKEWAVMCVAQHRKCGSWEHGRNVKPLGRRRSWCKEESHTSNMKLKQTLFIIILKIALKLMAISQS